MPLRSLADSYTDTRRVTGHPSQACRHSVLSFCGTQGSNTKNGHKRHLLFIMQVVLINCIKFGKHLFIYVFLNYVFFKKILLLFIYL